MKFLVIGRNGMIGNGIFNHFSKKYLVYGTIKKNISDYNFNREENIIENIDLKNFYLVEDVLKKYLPDVVINCSGIIKQKSEMYNNDEHFYLNGEVPNLLSKACIKENIRLINFSTDCVFDGEKGSYSERDLPNSDDIYGISKIKGEINKTGCLTIRTSTIGLEIDNNHGLIEWFLNQNGKKIVGYEKAIYSGLTIKELCRYVEHILINYQSLSGIYNMASKKISKYELLSRLEKKLKSFSIEIERDKKFVCDRSLDGRFLDSLTKFKVQSWEFMLSELAFDINQRT